MCIQWTAITPIQRIPTKPVHNPPCLTAIGRARIPVPMFPLIKCINVCKLLAAGSIMDRSDIKKG
uniref:Uncharacterized protein n=1 Tax=Arion vulgaris TaxID=1028688 RepID=A0A0B6Z8F8_9EUPU